MTRSTRRSTRYRFAGRLATGLILGLAAGLPVQAAIHALVIGIDEYRPEQNIQRLAGAVNDARDVADAIAALKPDNLVMLINGDAHRDAIFAAWDRLVAAAEPGDTLILSYAGHGGQEPERVPGSTAQGMVQTTILGGFGTRAPDNYQRIFDFEWRQRIETAAHLNLITVFDSCNSGSATRQAVVTSRPLRTRYTGVLDILDDTLDQALATRTPPRSAALMVAPNETYIGGTLDGQVVYEIDIDGRPRGAASHFFARALRGHADADGDGVLTRGELARYMVENVRLRTEARQTATVEYFNPADRDRPLLAVPTPTISEQVGPISVAIQGGPPPQGLEHARITTPGAASLVWQREPGVVLYQDSADVAATRIDTPERFQGVIDKWYGLQRIRQLAEMHPLQLRLDQGDGLHHAGDQVTIRIGQHRHPYLTLVNLAGDGTVQLVMVAAPTVLPGVPVEPPFGADHLIAIATPEAPEPMLQALRRINQTHDVESLYRALRQQADRGPYQLGLLGFHTAAR